MKILLVKTSSLGDIIHTFPVLDYLRRKFPDAQIDWIVEAPFAELVRANPQINGVLVIESKKWRKNILRKENRKQIKTFYRELRQTHYDLLIDLQGNLKSTCLVLGARAKVKLGFGWKTVPEWPNALATSVKINPPSGKNIREDYLAVIQGYFKDQSPYRFNSISLKLSAHDEQKLADLFSCHQKPTLVCPSSAWPNKCLADETLVKILALLNQGPYWFIWGSAAERDQAVRLSANFPGSVVLQRLSLPLLQHVMAKAKMVIAMDSLPLHLCGTTKTPSLSFFGPSSSVKYAPTGKQHLTIQGECPYGQSFEKRCPHLRTCKTGSCLKLGNMVERCVEAEILAQVQFDSRRSF